MPLVQEHAKFDNQRVTAGIPGLSPESRRDITERNLKRIYQNALVAEYQKNDVDAKRADAEIDVTDWDQVVGIPLDSARIIGRLRKLNSNLFFEVSHADHTKTGVYILRNDFKGGQEKHFLCGMETGINPEYSLRVLDDTGKPKAIVGGWRRVLMRLIRAGIIEESRTFRLFGPPSRSSENWARFTQ